MLQILGIGVPVIGIFLGVPCDPSKARGFTPEIGDEREGIGSRVDCVLIIRRDKNFSGE